MELINYEHAPRLQISGFDVRICQDDQDRLVIAISNQQHFKTVDINKIVTHKGPFKFYKNLVINYMDLMVIQYWIKLNA